MSTVINTDPDNEYARFIVWPVVKRMQQISAGRLMIEIDGGKVKYEIFADGDADYQPHSVEWTIENMIARYPDLFYSRTHAIHHLFIVLGCGYRWKGGCLVDKHDQKKRDAIPRAAARILAQHKADLGHPPYPWCDMCNLAIMPEDAAEDWKAAAEEAREILKQSKKGHAQ